MIDANKIDLSPAELRAVAGYAATCARPALAVFARDRPGDPRPGAAIDAAQAFADGGARTKAIREAAWAAMRAANEARDAGRLAAGEAARAALAAASAAYLHPLAKATQVRHILAAAGHAAHALEIDAGEAAGAAHLDACQRLANPSVIAVLKRYPPAPPGGGRAGALIRQLDAALR